MNTDVGESQQKMNIFRENDDLPNAVIVINVRLEVFDDAEVKENFCDLFRQIESGAIFTYLRSFRRIRVTFSRPESATAAKLFTQHLSFRGSHLKTYFAQRLRLRDPADDGLLKLPPLERQFLISPPASPPFGWEQSHEMAPVVYDGSNNKPKIVVHPAADNEEYPLVQRSIPKTPRPSES